MVFAFSRNYHSYCKKAVLHTYTIGKDKAKTLILLVFYCNYSMLLLYICYICDIESNTEYYGRF